MLQKYQATISIYFCCLSWGEAYTENGDLGRWFLVFNATFNNISVISWCSVLMVDETGVPEENYQPVGSHWQALSHNVESSTPCHERGNRKSIIETRKEAVKINNYKWSTKKKKKIMSHTKCTEMIKLSRHKHVTYHEFIIHKYESIVHT